MVVRNEMYKGLKFSINKNLNYLELSVDKQGFNKIGNCILSISIMVEYAIYIRPDYVVINNKLNANFKIPNKIIEFIKQILQQLRSNGIKKIILLVNEDDYIENIKIESFIMVFKNIMNFEHWLIENQKKRIYAN